MFDNLPTKEQFIIDKQQKQLEKLVSGIKAMNHLPDALFIVNLKYTMTAALEAKKMNIPIFAMVDTDSDPDIVSHIIPANDDSIKSINLIITHVVDAILQKSDFSVPTPPSDQQVTDPLTTINGAQSLNNPTDLPNLSATDDNPIPEIDN